MKSIPLQDLIGRIHPGGTSTQAYKDMDVGQTKINYDTNPKNLDGHPAIFHLTMTLTLKDLKYWPERDLVTFEQDVLAVNHQDALNQLGISVDRK